MSQIQSLSKSINEVFRILAIRIIITMTCGELRVPLDTTFSFFILCIYSASTVRRQNCPKQLFSIVRFHHAATPRVHNGSQFPESDSRHLPPGEGSRRFVRGLRHVPDQERLRQLNLFSLERSCVRVDLTLAFKMLTSKTDSSQSDFFLPSPPLSN